MITECQQRYIALLHVRYYVKGVEKPLSDLHSIVIVGHMPRARSKLSREAGILCGPALFVITCDIERNCDTARGAICAFDIRSGCGCPAAMAGHAIAVAAAQIWVLVQSQNLAGPAMPCTAERGGPH